MPYAIFSKTLSELYDELYKDPVQATRASGVPIWEPVRLAMVLRWCAGGSHCDIAPLEGKKMPENFGTVPVPFRLFH